MNRLCLPIWLALLFLEDAKLEVSNEKCIKKMLVILALVGCIVFLFVQNNQTKTVWGITIEKGGVVKSYNIDSEERYNIVLENEGMIPSGNLLKEIKILEPEYFNRSVNAKMYKILLIEYDGDVTTLELGWDKIYHIEYK